ncbi:hypothetical protein DEO72_LG2g4324 [Vigna unguiculata]|uniref:Uncharacterized protein n=1 Tax=Vigna unguiculata TaxID=3917 RepID=A0A4D6L6B1_VIGUN|nr:hypothetical protein DEO72_LG2g4324 [Vigna unguiculata]
MPHQIHLQHRLLPCTTYTIIAKHKQIGRQAPPMLLFLRVSPGGTTLIAKRYTLQFSTGFVAITWRANTTAKRYTSTFAVLVLSTQNKVWMTKEMGVNEENEPE